MRAGTRGNAGDRRVGARHHLAAGTSFGRPTIEPSLAWLLDPLTVESFREGIWAVTHHHIKRNSADYFDRLLHPTSAVEQLLELFRREPSAVRLIRQDDKKSGSENYRLNDGGLDIGGVRRDFDDGFTIVVDGVERHVRAIASLAQSIEVELNFPVQVNAYITPPGAQGLVPHYDDHDVVILQIEGSKIWHLYEDVHIPPHQIRNRDKAVPTETLPLPTDVRTEAGDVFYLPRGLVHAAEAAANRSVHLTVGLHAPTALTFAIGALHSLSFRDDRLNAQLPPRHLDDPDLQDTLGVLLRDAMTAVEDPGAIAGGLDALSDVLVRRGRCPPVGQVAHAAAIDGQTRVRKYRPLYSRVKVAADSVALQFASLSISAGRDHEAAMLFMSERTGPFRVCELPGLRADQRTALVRSLLTSGFLVRLPED
ncbi:cupin [Mycobacterium helveticum]|uniref:Cupin n=1 Tax=Mycobacterium helveticum TaxID=2592811 RepID=A0A557XD62_9MYCO|nr:cupin [Mycobacterium helveticum]TVS83483.1 cupin [Mycobacterium helveticum]